MLWSRRGHYGCWLERVWEQPQRYPMVRCTALYTLLLLLLLLLLSSTARGRKEAGQFRGALSASYRSQRGRCSISQYIKDRGRNGSIIGGYEYRADLVHMPWPLPCEKERPTGSRHGNLFGSRLLLFTWRVYQILLAAKHHREGLQVFST